MDDSGNRVSSSERPTLRDDDGSVPSSSVHAVVFNDDLLIEILLRLPVLTLLFFKSVSKRWLSLITSPAFFNLHLTRFPNIPPPSGLFLQQTNSDYDHFEHDFLSLNSKIPRVLKKKSSAFPFGCFGSDASNVEVLQSCNGLVLCLIKTNPADKIYVYNPSVNMFKMLPPVHGLKLNRNWDNIRLAFDPIKSPHYKVLHAQWIGLGLHETWIYSSETSRWERFSIKNPTRWFSGHYNKGVYWNDAIHWFDIWYLHVKHFKLGVEHPSETATLLPRNFHWNSYKELFASCGCLLLACARDPHNPKQLEIYEMRNVYTGWSIRYIVNYEESSSLSASLKMQKMSTVRFRLNVLYIVVGEREEESFVVMELCGKVVKYNLLLKTLRTLCHIDSNYWTEFQAFLFIASFASV